MIDEDREQFMSEVRAIIKKYGWAVNGIIDCPPFAYTTGLYELGFPELIMTGFEASTAHVILNQVGNLFREERMVPADGKRVHGILRNGFALKLRSVIPRDMGVTDALYGEGSYKALQVLWPDREGREGDAPDFNFDNEPREKVQPLLDKEFPDA